MKLKKLNHSGTLILAISYGSSMVPALLVPGLMKRLGVKRMMLISSFCYGLFIMANIKPSELRVYVLSRLTVISLVAGHVLLYFWWLYLVSTGCEVLNVFLSM